MTIRGKKRGCDFEGEWQEVHGRVWRKKKEKYYDYIITATVPPPKKIDQI